MPSCVHSQLCPCPGVSVPSRAPAHTPSRVCPPAGRPPPGRSPVTPRTRERIPGVPTDYSGGTEPRAPFPIPSSPFPPRSVSQAGAGEGHRCPRGGPSPYVPLNRVRCPRARSLPPLPVPAARSRSGAGRGRRCRGDKGRPGQRGRSRPCSIAPISRSGPAAPGASVPLQRGDTGRALRSLPAPASP